MEAYLRQLYARLISIGGSQHPAQRGVEIARQWLQTEINNGVPERQAIARHRREELPGLLEGARRIQQVTEYVRVPIRRAPATVTARTPVVDQEQMLREFIEYLQRMEDQRLLLDARRNQYQFTPMQMAQGIAVGTIIDYYGPVSIFLVRVTPIVGDIVDLTEAALGQDVFTGQQLSDGERALRAGFGIFGLITSAGRIVAALSRGSAAVIRGVASAASRIGATTQALTRSFRNFARFGRFSRQLVQVIHKIQNGVEATYEEIRLLRMFMQQVMRHMRIARGVALSAVEASGRILRNLTSRSGAAIRVVNQGGNLKFWRCLG